MRTVVVLQFGEVGVLGLVVGGRLGGVGGLGLLLGDDDGDSGLPGLAVRELQQIKIVIDHRC